MSGFFSPPAFPSTTLPLMEGTAAVGVATAYARADHVHPLGGLVVAKTADYGPAPGESGTIFTNEGVTGNIYFYLPPASVGLRYTFIVQDLDGMTVWAYTAGHTIRLYGQLSAGSGKIVSTSPGSLVELLAINATEWIAISAGGLWEVI